MDSSGVWFVICAVAGLSLCVGICVGFCIGWDARQRPEDRGTNEE